MSDSVTYRSEGVVYYEDACGHYVGHPLPLTITIYGPQALILDPTSPLARAWADDDDFEESAHD